MPNFGYLEDPEDRRDDRFAWGQVYGSTLAEKPSVNLWVPGQQIRDQGATNSCTGYSGAYAVRMAIYHQQDLDPGPMSPMFLYYISRAVWNGEEQDAGSYLRTLFRALQLQGCCTDKSFPEGVGVFKSPTWKAVKDAFKHRGVRSYRRITTIAQARQALSKGIPLCGGWSVGKKFVEWSGGDAYNGETENLGGHAMCVCGYNEQGEFISPNSWGVNAGEEGFTRFTPEFLVSGGRLWACDTEEAA
jgi:C1A family cysteine protease